MKIDVTSASAGSGKTYHLAQTALGSIQDASVRPEAIVAFTYTNKAASELAHRLRTQLISGGQTLAAARIRDGFLGTVHSVSQRMLGELAFENGRSPYPAVIPESYAERLFRLASSHYPDSRSDAFRNAVAAFDMSVDDSRDKAAYSGADWRNHLSRIVKSMRENRMSLEQLTASASLSVSEALAFYEEPTGDAAQRDAFMHAAFKKLLAYYDADVRANLDAGQKVTAALYKRQRWARELVTAFERGSVPRWGEIKAATGLPKGDANAAADAIAIFEQHLTHPRFHGESQKIITQLFEHAISAEAAYTTAKQEERLNDFEDILAETAAVLTSKRGQEQFGGRIDLLLVDEFQDTSPVQLQIITALASIAKRTVWVGDRKQAIFGFQGSDPQLMLDALQHALGPGGKAKVLRDSYRSRPPLVSFCSELFASALESRGFERDEVVLRPKCPEPASLEGKAAVHLWPLTDMTPEARALAAKRAREKDPDGIAAGVKQALEAGTFQVREQLADPTQLAKVRNARSGDIAVLARKNSACVAIADSLLSLGIPATVGKDELNSTPELYTVRAALSLLVDPRDGLAAAELVTFCGEVKDPDAWLQARIKEVSAPLAKGESRPLPFAGTPSVEAIRALAAGARSFTPSEAVVAVIEALNLLRRMTGWPQSARRRANLEVIKGIALEYEDICGARRSAATILGLVGHIDDLPDSVKQAAAGDDDAIRVLTYHKSKGLEWPVVISTSLADGPWDKFFGVRVVPSDNFDPTQPLAGREIRFLPWPYGAKKKGFELQERVALSEHGVAQHKRELAERARLLYVGFTRARDHLVLVRNKKGETTWLDELKDVEDKLVLADLPWGSPGAQILKLGGIEHKIQVSEPIPCNPLDSGEPQPSARAWFDLPAEKTEREAQPLRPSANVLSEARAASFKVAEHVSLGDRPGLNVAAEDMGSLGDAIHSFIAADLRDEDADGGARLRIADGLLKAHGFAGQVSGKLLLNCSDRFYAWLEKHGATNALPECPVQYLRPDGRVISGDIDLLAQIGEGWLIVDHKSSRVGDEKLEEKLLGYAGQLDVYRSGVEAAGDAKVVELWVHMPMRAEMIRVEVGRG